MKKFIFDLQRFAVINNDVSDTSVIGTDDDDSITNTGSNVTIEALDGDDSIYNDYCSNVSINAGSGNDTIRNEVAETGARAMIPFTTATTARG